MKKMLIAAAIVCAAVAAQAASVNWTWTTSSSGAVYLPGSTSQTVDGALMYIFADGLQSSVFNQWNKDGTMATGSLDSKTLTSAGLLPAAASTAEFSTEATGAKQGFFAALITDDGLFISAVKTGSESSLAGGTKLTFSFKSASQADAITGATAYSTSGWYAAVPEPTSGLLLLVGMAGLALRRKRA